MENNDKRSNQSYAVNNRIFFRLFQLGNVLQTKSTSNLGVTTVQWSVLGALSSEQSKDGFQFGALAEYLKVSRQNLDGVLRRLERDGLVERIIDHQNRRAKLVLITQKGMEFWESLEEGIDAFYREATSDFSFDELLTFAYLFGKLRKNLTSMSDTPTTKNGSE